MRESPKEANRHLECELGRAWESLFEGWRESPGRSNNALTRFGRHHGKRKQGDVALDPCYQHRLRRCGNTQLLRRAQAIGIAAEHIVVLHEKLGGDDRVSGKATQRHAGMNHLPSWAAFRVT